MYLLKKSFVKLSLVLNKKWASYLIANIFIKALNKKNDAKIINTTDIVWYFQIESSYLFLDFYYLKIQL